MAPASHHATRFSRNSQRAVVRCSRQEIWDRNLALQQTRQDEVIDLQRALAAHTCQGPSPATAMLYGQKFAAERAHQVAVLKTALLQADAAAYGQADLPCAVRQTAVQAVAGLAHLGEGLAFDPEHLWGRWTLMQVSAPGAFKPVAPQAFGAKCDAAWHIDVAAMTRVLKPSGAYCDTLILGTYPHPPQGAVMITGAVQVVDETSLRLRPEWTSCALTDTSSTDGCDWPAYDMPLRFLDDELLLLGDSQDSDACLQAWVRCD